MEPKVATTLPLPSDAQEQHSAHLLKSDPSELDLPPYEILFPVNTGYDEADDDNDAEDNDEAPTTCKYITHVLIVCVSLFAIAMIIIGGLFLRSCPVERGLPIILLVEGFLTLMGSLFAIAIFICKCNCDDCGNWQPNRSRFGSYRFDPRCAYLFTVCSFFVIGKFVHCFAARYAYNMRPDLWNERSAEYCHPTVFIANLTFVVTVTTVIGLAILYVVFLLLRSFVCRCTIPDLS